MDDSDDNSSLLFDDDSSASSSELLDQAFVVIHGMWMAQRPRRPICTSELSGCQYLLEFLNGHPDRLFDTIRMDIVAFRALYR